MGARRKSRTKKWVAAAIILIAAIGVTAVLLMRTAPTSYEEIVAQTGDITTYYSFSGNVQTKSRQTVISEKIMQISQIKVKEEEKIKEGAVLMKTTAGDDIKSEINGEVVNINVEESAQVMAGVKLLEIVDYDNLEIQVKVDEYDIGALAKGKDATVKIGALNKEFQGKISGMSREGQIVNGVTFFPATIDLEKDESIRIGMSAEVKLISNQVKGVVTIPMKAIQFDDTNKPYVLKRDEKNAVVKTEITTGINDGTMVEVKSGVVSGETILYIKVAAMEGMVFSGGGTRRGSANRAAVGGGDMND